MTDVPLFNMVATSASRSTSSVRTRAALSGAAGAIEASDEPGSNHAGAGHTRSFTCSSSSVFWVILT